MDFIKKSKWAASGKLSVIFGVVVAFAGLILSCGSAIGQTVTPTVTTTPTVSKKLLRPHKKTNI
jgi:hypothetical protein